MFFPLQAKFNKIWILKIADGMFSVEYLTFHPASRRMCLCSYSTAASNSITAAPSVKNKTEAPKPS